MTDSPAWFLEHVRAEAAWRLTRGAGTVIAVIDDAVDTRHPEFRDRVVPGRDVEAGSPNTLPRGFESHGTKCAGVACAGGLHVTGLAPRASLMPVRLRSVTARVGTPGEAEAIRWASDHGADVICCAWGPPDPDAETGRLPLRTRAAIDHATARGRAGKGCVIVWSAGNDDCNLALNGYASYPKGIAVGACNYHGRRSAYSNWGDALWCVFPSSDATDPTACRWAISTTTPIGSFLLGETFYTDAFGHTSAAAAGVAGLCALILSANPDLGWWEVKEVLRHSSQQIDPQRGRYDSRGHSTLYGFGRPDAGAAVELARQLRSVASSEPPSRSRTAPTPKPAIESV